MDYQQRKNIKWMQWALDKSNPFDYFEVKYGYKPTRIIKGKITIPFEIPDSIEVVVSKFNLINQIMLA